MLFIIVFKHCSINLRWFSLQNLQYIHYTLSANLLQASVWESYSQRKFNSSPVLSTLCWMFRLADTLIKEWRSFHLEQIYSTECIPWNATSQMMGMNERKWFFQSISCAGKLGFRKAGEIIWHFKPHHLIFFSNN